MTTNPITTEKPKESKVLETERYTGVLEWQNVLTTEVIPITAVNANGKMNCLYPRATK